MWRQARDIRARETDRKIDVVYVRQTDQRRDTQP